MQTLLLWLPMAGLSQVEKELDVALEASHGSYVESGQLFRQVIDGKLYKEAGFSGFRDYVSERWSMSPKTAYAYCQASDVAEDIKPLVLPQRHAQLLFRFSTRHRRRIAKAIQPMSARDATRWVMQEWGILNGVVEDRLDPPERELGSYLRSFMQPIRTLERFDLDRVQRTLDRLEPPVRRKAVRQVRALGKRLAALS